MTEPEAISRQMREHYETVWRAGDAWKFESSEFEQRRYEHLLAALGGQRYGRVLEIGCGSGCFTRLLAGISDRIVMMDIAAAAIERARAQTAGAGSGIIDLRVANIMDYDLQADGPWDLVVLGETIYCVGWLYPFFNVAWLAARLFDATCPGGRLLLSNTCSEEKSDWLLRPWLIRTYHDLCRNVGFRPEAQNIFRGTKDGVDFEVLTTLFVKPSG